MSKKLKDLKWKSVAVEGFPVSVDGFGGLEECTNYALDKEPKRAKKRKAQKKQKRSLNEEATEVPSKKIKLSNGFVVENCNKVTPSQTNDESEFKNSAKPVKKPKKKPLQKTVEKKINNEVKKNKSKLGENIAQKECNLTTEDMLSWAEFKLPEPIMKALAELGFKKPTNIQQLCLPAAIHGRRDILGAAETGSGKTLAFGLPILTGIIKLKEKAALGYDPYELPYKKTSNRRKAPKHQNTTKNRNKKRNNKKQETKAKESSEDGYSSGEDDDENKSDDDEPQSDEIGEKSKDNDDFIEEIDVPIRKRESSVDEGNDSDDENYIHLSDILDSEDLAETSSEEENDEDSNIEKEVSENEDKTDSDEEGEKEEELDNEVNENNEGIGCVKVIDDVEMPMAAAVRTGKPLYALILTPTRELSIQISRHLVAVARYAGIRVATIVGGMAAVKQERVLKSGPEIVVATPGRLWELITLGHPHLQQLDTIKFLAIDETDRMVERAHFEELTPLLERINADPARAATRQNFVFSATLTMVHDLPSHMRGKKVTKRGKILNRRVQKMTSQQKINKLVNMIGMTEPKVVDITQKNLGTADSLTESRVLCSADSKDACLYYILKRHPGRTIVFCNSISSVRRLAQLLTILKCSPLPLHASMQQRQRLTNLERFRDNPRGILVATDVAARGLDIPDVDHVIHYQVPKTAENYVHRSGRTARANKEGLTILMMEPAEAFLYSKLCHTLNRTSEVPQFPIPAASLSPFKQIVSSAREIERLEMTRRRNATAVGWREKVARDMDIILDDDDVPMVKKDTTLDKVVKARRRQLDAMLSRPMFPRGFSYKYPTLNDPQSLAASDLNALQVMKNALESGELKKEKRKSKNAPLLKLQKEFSKKCGK